MDLDELIGNIRSAKDQALADMTAYKEELDALAPGSLDGRFALTVDWIAADAIAATLRRILGEHVPRPERPTP